MIPYNVPVFVPGALENIRQACEINRKTSGDGPFTKRAGEWLENQTGAPKVLLTTSCSHALEMMAVLCDIQQGDEVIIPSFNFPSAANAIVLRGATCVFVDIRPDTMNIDETLVEQAITPRTRAISVMHYAGVACEMDTIARIARRHNLFLLEDAAQGMLSEYNGRPLGTLGDMGAYSFHETKNFSMGEGGCLILGDEAYYLPAEMLREKGTDRSRFFRGEVDKYNWQTMGSSYLPSEINAAYLCAQLDIAQEINQKRLHIWQRYYDGLRRLQSEGRIALPSVPDNCRHNGHIFFFKCRDLEERTRFIRHMRSKGVLTVFHYIPLHDSPAGKKYGRFHGQDRFTTAESERLVRLPLYYDLQDTQVDYIIECVEEFFNKAV
ncbi:MAG: dTDP-4-amino-4,6-dideoxygalactose transaminase [Bacillota bacterium]